MEGHFSCYFHFRWKLLCLLGRRIMGIQMTSQTFRITTQEILLMWRGMTFSTLRHISVLQMMTSSTVDLGVFARTIFPGAINLAVAGTTGSR